MRKLDARRWTLDDGLIARSQLGKNCAQTVCEAMNNQWVHYPQGMQNLWMSSMLSAIVSPLSRLFLSYLHPISTELYALKIRDITDEKHYFSTLSTPPIITTTTYI